jgi:hypothetical protein
MRSRLRFILALSILGVAVAFMPAHASESRVVFVTIACDGTNKHIDFNASNLGVSVARFIQGGDVTVVGTPGALLYLVVRTLGDEKKQVLTLGAGATHKRADLEGFVQVTTNASGQIPMTVDAACSPGAGALQALITVYFFS